MNQFLAQLAEASQTIPMPTGPALLVIYGPLGIVSAWLMFRVESRLESLSKDILAELRNLGHRINGLMKAQLVASLSQPNETMDPRVRALAKELLEQDDAKDSTGRSK